MSMSSVSTSGLQKPTSSTARRRNMASTPDTVNSVPMSCCERLMRPMIDENSPTCMRPSSVVRVRMRGLPVTAPMRSEASIRLSIHAMAFGSTSASPSMPRMYSPRASWQAVFRPTALPWLLALWITRRRLNSCVISSSSSPVPSVLPSLTAITS
ncbi:hypothetical protein D9M68_410550 [compost metagenome]